jgi:hypothetical protein
MTDLINWFTRFYDTFGFLGACALSLVLIFVYFLKGLVDVVVDRLKRNKSVVFKSCFKIGKKKDTEKVVVNAEESFIRRMDTCIADSISRLRPECKLKGAVFCYMLKIRMEENKKVGVELLNGIKDYEDKSTTAMAEIVVSKLHKSLNAFEERAREDGIPIPIISKFMQQTRITEEVIHAVAKRICLVEIYDNNTNRVLSVIDIIATLAILNIVDYQETLEAFNGKAKVILQEAVDQANLENKKYPFFEAANYLGCSYVKGKGCSNCDGHNHE